MIDAYLKLLERGYFEVTFAFGGLADENVWRRPAEGLLSIGELAGHIAYWEAVRRASDDKITEEVGEGEERDPIAEHKVPDLAKCRVRSPLIDQRFAYYPTTLATPPSEEHLSMTAEQVCQELLRVHEETMTYFKALNPTMEYPVRGWSAGHTYGGSLEYLVFHIAYHTGQMYSVRHLLGEQTPDN